MEMEAPRRSAADRSREPSMKKPRLSEDSSAAAATGDRIRPYAQARPAAASSYPRFRASEREREDSEETGRGGTSYQQQQEELVAQYKTALAELTFNSKPIITNLTIIAGENLHAAKAVASAVCANILEVPIEQKLPSLYLLDSIVKNIGRDYIKYFAARLPEVFCKAYKQVDPSIHSSMRHLFGTWKGIFSSSCLQLIEKDLGFSPIINGSSGGTVTRSDTQGQRPSHSIHVNPKYLEAARQRIQQSARGKDFSGEDVNDAIAPSDDAERSFRIPTSENMRQWSELSNKIHNVQRPQREQLNEFIHERKGYKDVRATVGSTHPSRQLDLVLGETIDRTKESVEPDKPYSGAGGITDSTAYGRNGFDAIHTYGRYRDSVSTPNDSQLPMVHLNSSNKMNWSTSKNWKNSEEEEYIWDDTGSRSADYEGPKSISSWSTDDQDKPASLQNRKLMSMETEQLNSRQNKFDVFQPLTKDAGMEERIPFRRDYEDRHSLHRNSQDIVTRIDKSAWTMHDTPQSAFGLDRFSSRGSSQAEGRTAPVSGVLSTNDNSVLPRSGFQSSTLPSSMVPSMDLIGTGGTLGLQKQLPLQSPSPSVPLVPSVPLQQLKPRSLVDQNYPPVHLSHVNQKSILLAGQFNRDSSTPIINDAFPILSENPGPQGHTSVNAQPSPMHASQLSSFPFPDLKRHLSSLQQSQSDPSVQAVQKETSTPVSQGLRANQSKGFSGARHSNSSIDVAGLSSTSNLLAATKKADLLPNNSSSGMWNLNIQPPLPSGPPPTQAQASSSPLATSSAEMPSSHGTAPSLTLSLQGVLPPLPPGPPPSSSLSGASPQTTNSASIGLNPLSSLLSSLVAKGLITSTSTQLPTISPIQMAKESPSQNSDLDGTTSSTPSSLKELPVSEPSTPGGVSLVSSTTTFDNLIGVQFKSEIVREFHSFVIDSLLDDLKHQCYECGLRFRHDEQLQVHMDWHNLKNSELSSTIKMYRRWYSSIINWVSGDVELACGPSLEAAPSEQPWEPMVTADEMQSICALCGEPFEDFYSVEKDEWMYKGTVYLNLMDAKCVARGMNGSKVQGPIVHAKCISTSTDGGVGQQS